MSDQRLPQDHPRLPPPRVGVLLVNLGTPDSTRVADVRRYLAEFLSDRRVIDTPRWLWKTILHGIILRVRPRRVARAYAGIWREDTDESPLRYHTRRQADALQVALDPGAEQVRVAWAMRYGEPSMASRIEALQAEGCDRVLLLPLYPQYCAATTATVNDQAFRVLMRMRWQPALRTARDWHDDPAYIDALARSIETQIETQGWEPEVILASFHGIPERYFRSGDPYHCFCARTTRLLRERLGRDENGLRLTFQSRFGPEPWLQPYTDDTTRALAEGGVRRLMIVTPGFAADCLETIEEIGEEVRELFMAHGGEHFARVDCLNETPAHIGLLAGRIRDELAGWIDLRADAPAVGLGNADRDSAAADRESAAADRERAAADTPSADAA